MIVGKCNCEEKNGTEYTSGNNDSRNYGNFEKKKYIYIWNLLQHNCCNYGNSETKDTVDSWWHNCCNCGKKQNKYESRWQQLSQLWQFWKILVKSIVAIMAILKTKQSRIPFHHNCYNYGNSEKGTVDSWWQQLLQLWQLWKKQRWIPVTTIVAIMAILKIAKIASLWQSSRLSCNSEI